MGFYKWAKTEIWEKVYWGIGEGLEDSSEPEMVRWDLNRKELPYKGPWGEHSRNRNPWFKSCKEEKLLSFSGHRGAAPISVWGQSSGLQTQAVLETPGEFAEAKPVFPPSVSKLSRFCGMIVWFEQSQMMLMLVFQRPHFENHWAGILWNGERRKRKSREEPAGASRYNVFEAPDKKAWIYWVLNLKLILEFEARG